MRRKKDKCDECGKWFELYEFYHVPYHPSLGYTDNMIICISCYNKLVKNKEIIDGFVETL